MKDIKHIVAALVIGVGVAYFVSAPLRKSETKAPHVGASLDSAKVYAEGVVSLSPEVQKNAAQFPALFLFARSPESPMPIAVKRYAAPTFPLQFSLTEENNMAGAGFFDGDIDFVARLDQDGAAGPKQVGDIEASVTLQKGASRAVSLTLK